MRIALPLIDGTARVTCGPLNLHHQILGEYVMTGRNIIDGTSPRPRTYHIRPGGGGGRADGGRQGDIPSAKMVTEAHRIPNRSIHGPGERVRAASDGDVDSLSTTLIITGWKQSVFEIADNPRRRFNYRFHFHISSIAARRLARPRIFRSFYDHHCAHRLVLICLVDSIQHARFGETRCSHACAR